MWYILHSVQKGRFHTHNTGRSYIVELIPGAKLAFLIVYQVYHLATTTSDNDDFSWSV